MPAGQFTPSQFEFDYPRWTAPAIGSTDTGKAWAWNNVTGKYEPTTFLLASAVSVYGLTLASAADAAAARTALALGTAAVLNVGTGASNIVQLDGSSRLPAVDGSQLTGITVAAAGSDTQVIYNAAGVYAGGAGLTYNASTDRLTVAGGIIAGDWSPPSDSTTAVSIWNAARTKRVAWVNTTDSRLEANSIFLADGKILRLGTDSDIQFYHDGATGMFYNNTGQFQFRNVSASQMQFFTTNVYRLAIDAIDNGDSAISSNVLIRHTTGGTPGAGFGLGIRAILKSSTTINQDVGRLTWEWVTATHASRASRGKLTAYYTSTEQEAMTWDGDAGGLKLSFYPGVTPVARQLLATGAGATVDDVITFLQNLGLARQS